MPEIGDRVRYNLDVKYEYFWQKEGVVVDKTIRCGNRNIIVVFDEPIIAPGDFFNGRRKIEFTAGCFEIISKLEPDWEI